MLTFSTLYYFNPFQLYTYKPVWVSIVFDVKYLKEFEYVDWLNIAKKTKQNANKEKKEERKQCKIAMPA